MATPVSCPYVLDKTRLNVYTYLSSSTKRICPYFLYRFVLFVPIMVQFPGPAC
jgi:hypothetical protein